MAITTSLTWTASNLVRETSDDFIIKSHWYLVGKTLNGTVGIATFIMEGVIKFNTTRTGKEIPYGNVTEENVVPPVVEKATAEAPKAEVPKTEAPKAEEKKESSKKKK